MIFSLFIMIYVSFVFMEIIVVLYIAYQIAKYIGIYVYIDTFLYFVVVFYLLSLILFNRCDDYLYLYFVVYLFLFQVYFDLYFRHNLHILVLFSEKQDVDPFWYVGHSQQLYITLLWLFGMFSLSDIDSITFHFVEFAYMDAPMCYNDEVVNRYLFILAILFYLLCVYWGISEARSYSWLMNSWLMNALFFFNYLMYICLMPFILY